jgi:hypothetical protein
MREKSVSGAPGLGAVFLGAFANLFRSRARARRALGNPNRGRASPLRFEGLEQRLLLSADLACSPVDPTFDNGDDLVLYDADGTQVTFKLHGAGNGAVVADEDGGWDVVLVNTNANTTFSVKARGGDGQVDLDDIRVGGAIGEIDAGDVHLTGTLAVDGALGAGLVLGSASDALVAAPSVGINFFGLNLGGIIILGDLEDSEILIGAHLGADGQPGGTGPAADAYGRGELTLLTILGSVEGSAVRVGQDPVNGVLDDCDDVIRGGAGSSIGLILIGGELSADSRIIAGDLPAWAWVDGRLIRTADDPRFKTDVHGPDLELALANDTGASTADGLTRDPSIAGDASDAGGIAALRAGFGGTATVDITDELAADGFFLLSRSELEEIYGAPLVDGSYTLTIEATDAQGNACPQNISFTLDSTSPTVTIDQAAGQEDPASDGPILFTVEFSEAVTGFSGADLSFAGSTAGSELVAEVTGSGSTYTVSVTGMSGAGTVVVSVPAAAAADAAGNTSGASTSTDNSVTVRTNQAPVAGDDFFSSRPGRTEVITFEQLLDDDTDADGDALRVVDVDRQMLDEDGNVLAEVELEEGQLRVTPSGLFIGAGRFSYRIADDSGGFDAGEVTITYFNQAPVAGEDLFFTRPGQTETITFQQLLDDDTDADGDALRVVDVGRVVLDAMGNVVAEVIEVNFEQGTLVVAPAELFTGAGHFSYRITDDFGGVDDGDVTITYVNQEPVAGDDAFSSRPGQTEVITFEQLLDDDMDADGDALRVADVDRQVLDENGNVVAEVELEEGQLRVTPTGLFVGAGRFSYRIGDGHGGFDQGEATITYANQAPVAGEDLFFWRPGQTEVITFEQLLDDDTDADGDALRLVDVDRVVRDAMGNVVAEVVEVNFEQGTLVVAPAEFFTGAAHLSYRITDDFGGIDDGDVTITYIDNDPPVTDEAFIELPAGEVGVITFAQLLEGDFDPNGDVLRVESAGSRVMDVMGNVVATVEMDFEQGRLVVTPTTFFTGAGRFNYRIADGNGGFDDGEVTLIFTGTAPEETQAGVTLLGDSPELQSIFDASLAAWSSMLGLDAAVVQELDAMPVEVVDLVDGSLAYTDGTTIFIDADAAGHGWFVDATPLASEEYELVDVGTWQALEFGRADDAVDLFTVVTRQLGHLLGFDHESGWTVMQPGTVAPGMRYTIDWNAAAGASFSGLPPSTLNRSFGASVADFVRAVT